MQAPAAYEHSQRLINGLRRSMNKALTVASQVAPRFLNKLSKTVGVAIALATFAVSAQAPLDVRVALIIGNSAYIGAPSLANPANDARAMGEVLRSLGFQVIELRDGNKAQMTAAISRVQESLKGKQAVAMLYYAGHGLQLDWRNYMVPVDARLASAADVPRQTIDLGSVIDTFKGAGTRMNIMVLDACRDNPFASSTSSAKGLAQLDAPPGTFLAYATAPGNVAEDGDEKGGNGMYTQYLLLELRKPFGKIEDVFKRVRLSVRQKTPGPADPLGVHQPGRRLLLQRRHPAGDQARRTRTPGRGGQAKRTAATAASQPGPRARTPDCPRSGERARGSGRCGPCCRRTAPAGCCETRRGGAAGQGCPSARTGAAGRRDQGTRGRAPGPGSESTGPGALAGPGEEQGIRAPKGIGACAFHRPANWRPGANRT
jgi:hypothetical protein